MLSVQRYLRIQAMFCFGLLIATVNAALIRSLEKCNVGETTDQIKYDVHASST